MAEKKRILDGLVDLGADKDDDECFRKAVEAVKNGTDPVTQRLCFVKKSLEERMDDLILQGSGIPQISYAKRPTDPSKDPMVIYADRHRRIVKQVHEMISRNEKPDDMPEGLSHIYRCEYDEMIYYITTSDDEERQEILSQIPDDGACTGGKECFLKAVETVRNNLIKQIHEWIENGERPDDMWPGVARMYDVEFSRMKHE